MTSEQHDDLAKDIVKRMISATVKPGGSPAEIMVLLESVTLGVLLSVHDLTGAAEANVSPREMLAWHMTNLHQRMTQMGL